MTKDWLLLGLAVAFEMVGFYALNISEGFSRIVPTLAVFASFLVVYWLLARIMKRLPLGMAYALWSGGGTTLTSLMDSTIFGQRLVLGQTLGIGLIVVGVVWLNLSTSGSESSGATERVRDATDGAP